MSNWASTSLDVIKRQLDGLTAEELLVPYRAALHEAKSEQSVRRLRAIMKELEAQRKLDSEEKLDKK